MRLIANYPVAASIVGVGMAAVIAGCASSGSPASTQAANPGAQASPPGTRATTPGTAVGTQAATANPSANPASASPSTTPQAGSAPSCATSDLKISQGGSGAAAGSVYIPIQFTNTSASTCTLYGYPGVALTTSTTPGSQVGAAATRSTAKPKTLVTLSPGATASATLQIAQVLNYPTASCGPVSVSYLQVYPPGQTTATYLPYQGKGCAKSVFVLGIATVQPGTGA